MTNQVSTPTPLQNAIKHLRSQARSYRQLADKIDEAVQSLRAVCPHIMREMGVDQAGVEHLECELCGHEETVATITFSGKEDSVSRLTLVEAAGQSRLVDQLDKLVVTGISKYAK